MRNLLEETLEFLKDHGVELQDIQWVGCREFQIPISEFLEEADAEYDNGFGWQEVASDLIVVGDNFWLERHEYDGSEWWEFKAFPTKPTEMKTGVKILYRHNGWKTLAEMQEVID